MVSNAWSSWDRKEHLKVTDLIKLATQLPMSVKEGKTASLHDNNNLFIISSIKMKFRLEGLHMWESGGKECKWTDFVL